MATWILKSEIDDPKRALAMVEEQRRKGFKVWVEDENGGNVDEESLKNSAQQTGRSLYELRMAILIWGTTAVIAIGGLYACSFLAGD